MKFVFKLVPAFALIAAVPGAAQHNMTSMDHSRMMQSTPANPYSEAEIQMHERMMQAIGADPDETFARKMIEHHRGALEMSRILAARGSDRELRAMAMRSSAQQRREIAELESWLRRHGRRRH